MHLSRCQVWYTNPADGDDFNSYNILNRHGRTDNNNTLIHFVEKTATNLNSITYSNMQYIYNHLTSMSHTPCSNYNVRVTRAVVVVVVEVVVVATRHHGSTPHCGLSLQWQGGYLIEPPYSAFKYMLEHFPDWGVEFTRSDHAHATWEVRSAGDVIVTVFLLSS